MPGCAVATFSGTGAPQSRMDGAVGSVDVDNREQDAAGRAGRRLPGCKPAGLARPAPDLVPAFDAHPDTLDAHFNSNCGKDVERPGGGPEACVAALQPRPAPRRLRRATDALPPKVAAMLNVTGDGQRGAAGDPLPMPLVVQVQDGTGRPARGAAVTWTVTAGGGRIELDQPTAGAGGKVPARWVLGPGLGANEVAATADRGAPVRFSATAVAGPPANIAKAAGDAQAGRAGAPLPVMPEVRVTDAHGNPVQGATVQWSPSGSGSASPAASVTDPAGRAWTRWTLGRAASRQQLAAAAAGTASVSFESTAGPNVLSIVPRAFGAGDTVAIGGFGLGGAVVEMGGVAASMVAASDTLLRVVAPPISLRCAEVHPRLSVRITAAGGTVDTAAESLGAALPGPGAVGGHVVLASVGRAGCRVVLEPGTYGVAVYRTLPPSPAVPNNFPPPYDTARVHATLAVRPVASTGATSWRTLTLVPDAGTGLGALPASPPDGWTPAGATAPARACSRPPGAVSDTIRLINAGPIAGPTPGGTTLYRIRYTTPHFNWLFTDTLTIPSWIAPELPGLIRRAESDLYPILERTFGQLPDLDSNGRLNVVVAKLGSASGFFGGTEIYADGGCKSGAFVWLSSGNAFWGNLAHAATH